MARNSLTSFISPSVPPSATARGTGFRVWASTRAAGEAGVGPVHGHPVAVLLAFAAAGWKSSETVCARAHAVSLAVRRDTLLDILGGKRRATTGVGTRGH